MYILEIVVFCIADSFWALRNKNNKKQRSQASLTSWTAWYRVSVQGVKSLDSHFACLCRGFDFYEVKKNIIIIFQKEKGNTFTLLIIFIVKSGQKRKIAQIYYDPQSAGINLQSP